MGTSTPVTSNSLPTMSSNDSKPVRDLKLEAALNGQEPTVRNLIMAAIGVMKNRKARPDTKRICNWIHRRYGNPLLSVNEELERLVKVGELARVDYKGSASFRIVNKDQANGQGSKQKRKKKVVALSNVSID